MARIIDHEKEALRLEVAQWKRDYYELRDDHDKLERVIKSVRIDAIRDAIVVVMVVAVLLWVVFIS